MPAKCTIPDLSMEVRSMICDHLNMDSLRNLVYIPDFFEVATEALYRLDAEQLVYNQRALIWAAFHGREKTMELSLRFGGARDITAIRYWEPLDSWVSPLHAAAAAGNTREAAVLLERGAFIDQVADIGTVGDYLEPKALGLPVNITLCTPLGLAIFKGHVDTCLWLLLHGASFETVGAARDEELLASAVPPVLLGFHAAAMAGMEPVIEYVLEAGVNVNVTDDFGRNALHWATMAPNAAEVCQLLVAAGADPQALDLENRGPLHFAGENLSADAAFGAVQVLAAVGADLDGPDMRGKRPYTLAVGSINAGAMEGLLAAGALPNMPWELGTPMEPFRALVDAVETLATWGDDALKANLAYRAARCLRTVLRVNGAAIHNIQAEALLDVAMPQDFVDVVRALWAWGAGAADPRDTVRRLVEGWVALNEENETFPNDSYRFLMERLRERDEAAHDEVEERVREILSGDVAPWFLI